MFVSFRRPKQLRFAYFEECTGVCWCFFSERCNHLFTPFSHLFLKKTCPAGTGRTRPSPPRLLVDSVVAVGGRRKTKNNGRKEQTRPNMKRAETAERAVRKVRKEEVEGWGQMRWGSRACACQPNLRKKRAAIRARLLFKFHVSNWYVFCES